MVCASRKRKRESLELLLVGVGVDDDFFMETSGVCSDGDGRRCDDASS